jgi:hypothetical protein
VGVGGVGGETRNGELGRSFTMCGRSSHSARAVAVSLLRSPCEFVANFTNIFSGSASPSLARADVTCAGGLMQHTHRLAAS